MTESAERIIARKREQLALASTDLAVSTRSAGWEEVHLVPCSLPEVSADGVELSTCFLGHELSAPLVIAAMTGGHPEASAINARLGAAAERLGIAVGVGSQRAALLDPALEQTYASVREHASTALVIANIGVCQLVRQGDKPGLTAEQLRGVVEMVDAQALAVHLNVLEEAVQPEGDHRFDGLLYAIEQAVASVSVPLIAKETGSGMTRESAVALAEIGVAALDVGGAGGTSFAHIEALRAERQDDRPSARLGQVFGAWGLPTAPSILEATAAGLPIIATGGVRTGLDAAKALSLGADLVGVGRLVLDAARDSAEAVEETLRTLLTELRLALVLCGAHDLEALRLQRPVLTGFTAEWARQRTLG